MDICSDDYSTLLNGVLDMRSHREALIARDGINRLLPDQKLPEALGLHAAETATPRLFNGRGKLYPGSSHNDGLRRPDRWLRSGGRWKRIEVKATGRHGSVSITASDRLAEYVIWTDYRPFFAGEKAIAHLLPGSVFRNHSSSRMNIGYARKRAIKSLPLELAVRRLTA